MKYLLTLFITTLLSFNSFGQNKKVDTIPPEKTYTFVIGERNFKIIDSILQRSYGFVGKSALFEEVELLRSNLAAVINYFLQEKSKQDAIKPKTK